jgi:hypothetical protein
VVHLLYDVFVSTNKESLKVTGMLLDITDSNRIQLDLHSLGCVV